MNRAATHPLTRALSGLWHSLWDRPQRRQLALLLSVLGATLLWAYWPTLIGMADRWANDPKYSHGYLVPIFALIVLWVRRADHPDVGFHPSALALAWLVGAAVLRLLGAVFYLEALDALSLLPALAGLCVLLGGTPALRWAWPAIGFLIFMMPAPFQLEVALAQPLQRVASSLSTYLLQTAGLPAVQEGTVIWIDEERLSVVEACSGLGMLITFFALSTAFALVLARSWADRIILFVSALPIAVLTNVLRITVTGILYVTASKHLARLVYHDLAGWLMMPLALLLLWLELKFLSRLFVDPETAGPLPVTSAAAPRERALPPRVVAAPTPPASPVGETGPR